MTTDEYIALAELAASAIAKIMDAVKGAKEGKMDPATALAGIQLLHDQIDMNNAAADAALEKRFGKTEPPAP